jgi:hypothetical protein
LARSRRPAAELIVVDHDALDAMGTLEAVPNAA